MFDVRGSTFAVPGSLFEVRFIVQHQPVVEPRTQNDEPGTSELEHRTSNPEP